jgi:chlorophyll(ide) b reductase
MYLEHDLRKLRLEKKQLKVCITGSSRGLGKAMTEDFLEHGDKVFIISRDKKDIAEMVLKHDNLYGYPADIANKAVYPRLFDRILDAFDGEIDMFLCCAGQSGGFTSMIDHDYKKIESIIQTNLLGTALCCRYAFDIMNEQPEGGAIFNFTGAGSNGSSTPNYALYGATKAAILQLTKTLQEEWRQFPVDLHLVSPGMLFTDLLLENMNEETYDAIKILIAQPDIVANHVVPRMRSAYYHAKEDNYIKFLTVLKIIYKMTSNMLTKKEIDRGFYR